MMSRVTKQDLEAQIRGLRDKVEELEQKLRTSQDANVELAQGNLRLRRERFDAEEDAARNAGAFAELSDRYELLSESANHIADAYEAERFDKRFLSQILTSIATAPHIEAAESLAVIGIAAILEGEEDAEDQSEQA